MREDIKYNLTAGDVLDEIKWRIMKFEDKTGCPPTRVRIGSLHALCLVDNLSPAHARTLLNSNNSITVMGYPCEIDLLHPYGISVEYSEGGDYTGV